MKLKKICFQVIFPTQEKPHKKYFLFLLICVVVSSVVGGGDNDENEKIKNLRTPLFFFFPLSHFLSPFLTSLLGTYFSKK